MSRIPIRSCRSPSRSQKGSMTSLSSPSSCLPTTNHEQNSSHQNPIDHNNMSTPWFCPNVIPQRSRKGQGIKRPPRHNLSPSNSSSFALRRRNELREDFGTRFSYGCHSEICRRDIHYGRSKSILWLSNCCDQNHNTTSHEAGGSGIDSTDLCFVEGRRELQRVAI